METASWERYFQWGTAAPLLGHLQAHQSQEAHQKEYGKVLESHLFLKQKQDNSIKGYMVAGGNKERKLIPAQEASPPLQHLNQCHSCRPLMTIINIPNTFVQTHIKNKEDKAIMRMWGTALAWLLNKVTPSQDLYQVHHSEFQGQDCPLCKVAEWTCWMHFTKLWMPHFYSIRSLLQTLSLLDSPWIFMTHMLQIKCPLQAT